MSFPLILYLQTNVQCWEWLGKFVRCWWKICFTCSENWWGQPVCFSSFLSPFTMQEVWPRYPHAFWHGEDEGWPSVSRNFCVVWCISEVLRFITVSCCFGVCSLCNHVEFTGSILPIAGTGVTPGLGQSKPLSSCDWIVLEPFTWNKRYCIPLYVMLAGSRESLEDFIYSRCCLVGRWGYCNS